MASGCWRLLHQKPDCHHYLVRVVCNLHERHNFYFDFGQSRSSVCVELKTRQVFADKFANYKPDCGNLVATKSVKSRSFMLHNLPLCNQLYACDHQPLTATTCQLVGEIDTILFYFVFKYCKYMSDTSLFISPTARKQTQYPKLTFDLKLMFPLSFFSLSLDFSQNLHPNPNLHATARPSSQSSLGMTVKGRTGLEASNSRAVKKQSGAWLQSRD